MKINSVVSAVKSLKCVCHMSSSVCSGFMTFEDVIVNGGCVGRTDRNECVYVWLRDKLVTMVIKKKKKLPRMNWREWKPRWWNFPDIIHMDDICHLSSSGDSFHSQRGLWENAPVVVETLQEEKTWGFVSAKSCETTSVGSRETSSVPRVLIQIGLSVNAPITWWKPVGRQSGGGNCETATTIFTLKWQIRENLVDFFYYFMGLWVILENKLKIFHSLGTSNANMLSWKIFRINPSCCWLGDKYFLTVEWQCTHTGDN